MSNLAEMMPEHRRSQLEFFQIDDDVISHIRHLKPRAMTYAKIALETMFEHLEYNPDVSDYFSIGENLAYLRAGMLAHCELVFSARFDDQYYQAAEQIGIRHSKLDYPSHVYTAAYSNMLANLMSLALSDKKPFGSEDIAALTKIACYDMELTVAAFFRTQMEKQAALDADAGKIRHLL